jgi:hypothetical protein
MSGEPPDSLGGLPAFDPALAPHVAAALWLMPFELLDAIYRLRRSAVSEPSDGLPPLASRSPARRGEWMNLDAWIEHTGRQFSREHAKRKCQTRELRCVKFGKVWLVHRDALDLLDAQ